MIEHPKCHRLKKGFWFFGGEFILLGFASLSPTCELRAVHQTGSGISAWQANAGSGGPAIRPFERTKTCAQSPECIIHNPVRSEIAKDRREYPFAWHRWMEQR
jgi:hypothetical protein